MKLGETINLLANLMLFQIATNVSCKNFERTCQTTREDDDDLYENVEFFGNVTTDPYAEEVKVFLQMITRENSSTIYLPVPPDFEFYSEKPIVFIIHGWLSSSETDWTKELANAYLEREDVIVFIVDWSSLAEKGYIYVISRIDEVASELVNFIKFLINKGGVDVSHIHIIGHSLGAHISGISGKKMPNLNRITGLDPAGPGFPAHSDKRLSSSDANYVDVIHTNSGRLGNKDILGQVDFFVNGGKKQPGCLWSSCSHRRAVTYFTESIENPQCLFVAAETEEEAAEVWTENIDERRHTVLGLDTFEYQARGAMFIVTKQGKDSPFCRESFQPVMEVQSNSCKTTKRKSSLSGSKVGQKNHNHSCEVNQQEIHRLQEENDSLKAERERLDLLLRLLAEKQK